MKITGEIQDLIYDFFAQHKHENIVYGEEGEKLIEEMFEFFKLFFEKPDQPKTLLYDEWVKFKKDNYIPLKALLTPELNEAYELGKKEAEKSE
jgi:hypothetical protein